MLKQLTQSTAGKFLTCDNKAEMVGFGLYGSAYVYLIRSEIAFLVPGYVTVTRAGSTFKKREKDAGRQNLA